MAVNAVDVLIAIKARDDASNELNKIHGTLSSLGKTAISVGQTLAVGLAAGTAALAAGLGASANAAAGFEQTMSGVKAVSGATAEQMGLLSAKALELGKATVFSASEAGAGIEELVKGGISIDDVMGGAAEATLALASAGGVDLVTAATIASNALNGFNLKGEDMAHISDVIAGAANASAIDVNQFGLALSQSAAVAKLSGLSFDDLAVGIAELGNAGIKGSDAGTSLKTMLASLSPTSKPAIAAMEELGIITESGSNQFYDAQHNLKGFADISQVLQDATRGLTEEQKVNALQTMFGTDAIRAAAIMADNGAAGFDKLAASMAKVTAADVAKERLNNLRGDLEQLKGSVETAAITLGLALLPALRDATKGATEFVNGLIPMIEVQGPAMVAMLQNAGAGLVTFAGNLRDSASDALQGVADKLAETGAAWAPWAAQAGPAGDAVSSTLSGVSGVIQALQLLLQGNFAAAWSTATESLGKFASPADLVNAAIKAIQDQFIAFAPTGERVGAAFDTIATAITGLIAIGVNLATQFEQSGVAAATTSGAMDGLVIAVNGVSAGFEAVTKFVQDNVAVQAALVGILAGAATAWALLTAVSIAHAAVTNTIAIATKAYTAAQWLLNVALTANPIGLLIVALAAFAAALIYAYNNSEEFRAVVDAVFAAVLTAGKALIEFVRTLPGTIQGALEAAGNAFSSFGSNVQAVLAAIGGFFSNIGTQIQAGLASIGGFFSGLGSTVRAGLDAVGATVGGFFSGLGTMVKTGVDAVVKFFTDAWNSIPEDIRDDLATVIHLIGEHFSALGSLVQAGMAAVGEAISAGWTAVSNAVGGALSAIGSAVESGWAVVTFAVGAAMSSVGTAVDTGWTAVSTAVGGAMSALGSAVQTGWDAVSTIVTTVLDTVTTNIQTGWDTITAAASKAWDGLSSSVGTALDAVLTTVGTWIKDFLGKFTGLAGDMSKAGSDAGQALVDGLTGAITRGIQAVGDKAAEIARGTLSEAKKALGAESPSKEFAKLGVNIGEGLIQGIQSMKAETAAEMNAILKSAVSGIKSSGGGAFLTIPQFGSAIRSLGFNESTISAICGPIAAQGIAEGLGKSISLIDVEAISTKIGAYAKGAGTFGSGAFQKILSAIGIDSRSGSFQEAVDAAMKGIPVAISTPLHYFLAQGFDQATQQFVVGNTGTALKAGAEKMTRAAIEGVAGAATYIIPAVQAAGAAVRTLATDIATGFDSVATPAVFDLEAAITDLVGTNELWQQLDANASQTGRDLATFLGDIAAPGVELVTSSLSELQAMSGLTLPQIQEQAAATGKDLRHWLLEVGVPSAVRLAEEFKALQDRAGPALEATGVSLRVLARDIEASFTSTAPTAIDKFFSLLEKLATDVDAAGDDIASKMEDIATKVASGIAKATEDGARQIADAMRSAQDQLDQLGGSLADPTSTTVKQSGLAGEISAAKALHAQQRSDADQLFFHQRDLTQENTRFAKDTAKAAIQLEKDLARAKSDVDRSGIVQKAADARAALNEAHKAQIDSLDTGFAQKVSDNERSRALDAADRAFNLAEDAKMVKFRQAAIIAERDAKILAAKQATTDKLAEVQDLATKERAILAQSYVDKIADLKAGLLDKLPGLTGEAAVVVNGVFDQVATQAAGVTGAITGAVATASDAAQTLVATYGIKIEEANAIVNDHGAVVRRVLGVDVPGSMGLTDTAVENFADAFHVSWDTAREMLTATGKLSDAVMGKQIPGAAKDAAKVIDDSLGVKVPKSVGLTGTALDLAGVSAGNLKKPVNDATAAAKSFAKDGLDVAKDAASDFGSKQGEIAASITTQIAAVLLRLRDGLLGEGDYKGKGLIQAVKDLGTALLALPTDIKVNITTNQTGGLMAGVAGAGPAEFAQSGISEGSNRNAPSSNVSPFPGHIGESGPGGKYNDPTTGKPYTRAVGGPVKANWPYLIGEQGPEMFVSKVAGTIVPNGDISGFLAKALGGATGKQQTPADYIEQVSALLAKLPRSVPVQIRATVTASGLPAFLQQLGTLPGSMMVEVAADSSDAIPVITRLRAALRLIPGMVRVPISVDPGRSSAILDHLQDTLEAIPPSVETMLGVNMGTSQRLINQFTASLNRLPSTESVMVHLNTAAAEQDLKGLQDQIAEPVAKAGPNVDVAMVASPQTFAGGRGVEIDYDRLGEAVASRMARAMQGLPAPRVAVEDIRSSLVAVGMRNGGQVGLA